MTGSRLALAAYRAVAAAVRRLPLGGTLGRSIQGREASADWWQRLAPKTGPRIWVHAASVGEAIVAEPVVRRLHAMVPGLEVTFSYSSPSMQGWALDWVNAGSGFVPAEAPAIMQNAFDQVAPDLLLFSRSDLWPEMLLAANEHRVPVAVCGGVIRASSWRSRWPARPFLSGLYRRLAFVGTISDEDRHRWIGLGCAAATTVATGDPRHDQVLERITRLETVRSLGRWMTDGPLLLAGSVEEGEEPMLLGALSLVRRSHPEARLLVVPHHPGGSSRLRIRGSARRLGLAVQEFRPGDPSPSAPCVVVTARGLLADLYAGASATYVGGGFRRRLHAVIEPAAYGLSIAVGPDFRDHGDAEALVERGGAFVLPRRGAARALGVVWRRWIENPAEKQNAGLNARRGLQQGAAAITARYLRELLPAGR